MRVAIPPLLAFSGAAALLHESAWFRLLVPVLGAGALPSAAVAAGALLGLAAGSALGGRLADRSPRPAQVFAAAEALAAATGLVVPHALGALAHLPPAAALAAAVLLLAVAAIPWGVTLPAAVRVATGSRLGPLYAWNVAGAVAGVAAGAVYCFEAFGNRGTVLAASALQAAVAGGVFAFSVRSPTVPSATSVAKSPAMSPPTRLHLAAAALAGAAGVAAQLAWMRRLTPVLGATFPVFAAVLAVHLAGIALGTWLLGPRTARHPGRAIVLLAIVAAAATAAAPFALGALVESVRERWWATYGDALAMLGLRSALAAALVLPGVLTGAALLPWFAAVGSPSAGGEGRHTGGLLAANCAGSAAGGLVTALWLVPAAGTAGALVVCGAVLLAAGGLAVTGRPRAMLVIASAIVGAAVLASPPCDAAGHRAVGALYSERDDRPDDTTTLVARDGRTASVLVRDRDGRREFWVEGSFEASTGPTDRLHLGLLAHLPLVLWEARPERPAHVALVGLGAGYTAQAAARHRPASLTVFELEPEVVRAAETFRDEGGGLPDGARFVFGDGRRAVLASSAPLDVLSSDPVHPALAGSAYLYSADYWRGAAERISEDGLIVQWLPLYQLHVDDIRLVVRTFAASVPCPYLFVAGPDAILVGTKSPLVLPFDRLGRALASDAAAPLRDEGLGSPGRLLSLFAAGPAELRALAGEGDVNTDDRLVLELRTGWREAGDPEAALVLLTSERADPHSLLAGAPDAAFAEDLAAGRELGDAFAAWTRGDSFGAAEAFDRIATREPANLLAARMRDEAQIADAFDLVRDGRLEDAAAVARDVASRPDAEPFVRLDAAEVLDLSGRTDEARAIAAPYALAHDWPRARRLAAER